MDFKKTFSILAVASCLLASNSNFVKADTIININDNGNNSTSNSKTVNTGTVYKVANERTLETSVDSVNFNDVIVLSNDITLTHTLKITKNVNIDLNGHNISMKGENAKIEVGYEEFDHLEAYDVYHEGHWSTGFTHNLNSTGTSYTYVWHPGYNEVKYKNVYRYGDNIHVTFSNGTITGAKGHDGKDGVEDSSYNYHGKDGENGGTAINFISGNIHFVNMYVIGGDGGNGGNGSYQSLWHVPLFGGGRGGNGGNGGKGASAMYLTRKECTYTCDNSKLIGGNGGKGGKGSKANQNYWIYSARDGKDGKNG